MCYIFVFLLQQSLTDDWHVYFHFFLRVFVIVVNQTKTSWFDLEKLSQFLYTI